MQNRCKTIDLLNKYVIDGIERDTTPNKPVKSIEEIKKLLDYDKPERDNILQDLTGIVSSEEIVDPVKEKKELGWLTMIFIDTSYIIALLNKNTTKYKEAIEISKCLQNEQK